MGPRKRHVTFYEVILATVILVWFMNQAGALPRLTPVVIIDGTNYGFYIFHLGILLVVWLVLLFIETSLDIPVLMHHMRSNQGTSTFMDIIILLVSFYILTMAFGANILWRSPYLITIPIVTILAAFISLLTGREYARSPHTFSTQESAEPEDRQQPTNDTNE